MRKEGQGTLGVRAGLEGAAMRHTEVINLVQGREDREGVGCSPCRQLEQ